MTQSPIPAACQSLIDRIDDQSITVGIIGLGYVGLPLIDAFSQAGIRCLGFDVDQAKIDSLADNRSYIKHISDELIASWKESPWIRCHLRHVAT